MQVISTETDEAEVIQCWVYLCLHFGQEQKAIDAASKIKGFKLSLVTHFARYYEGTGQWQKSKSNVEKILKSDILIRVSIIWSGSLTYVTYRMTKNWNRTGESDAYTVPFSTVIRNSFSNSL